MSPERQETVKALSWQLLYGNYRPKLGDQGWNDLAAKCNPPEFRSMDGDVDVPMEPFNQALLFIDQRLGSGDGTYVEEVARLSVERWGSMFRNLVKQLAGRPNKMLEIFAREVHPYFLADAKASALEETRDGFARIRMDNSLVETFKVGLLRGFVEITGSEAKIQKLSDGSYGVQWTLKTDAPTPSAWALFVNAVRLPFLTATLVPVLVGAAIAAFDFRQGTVAGEFDWLLFAFTLVGVAFFHLGTNTANDYFDHRSGADEANFTPTPFSGGSRVIQRGLMDAKTMGRYAATFYTIGILIGLSLVYLIWQRSGNLQTALNILWLGIAGFLLGVLYTAPPARLSHRGIGELSVAVGFGPLIVMGAYFVQVQAFSTTALLASLPIGFLIAAVLYINEFPDKDGDARVGKRTLIVRLPDRAAVVGYHILITLAYLSILAGVILKDPNSGKAFFPIYTLAALLTFPLAFIAMRILNKNYRFPYRLIPANAFTILIHLATGVLFFAGYIAAIFLG